MDRGEARVALVIPEGMSRDLRSGRVATVQVIINGDNANTATTVFGYAQAIVRGVSAQLQLQLAGGRGAARRPSRCEPRIWYNPELQSTLFLVPGLIGVHRDDQLRRLHLAVDRAREGARHLGAGADGAHLDTVSYVVGKTIPYFVISLRVGAAHHRRAPMLLFGLPVRGSWLLLLAAVSLFLVGALGTGLLVSTLVDSQALAFLIGLLISLLPTFILSGFIFPIASMPGADPGRSPTSCRRGTSWSSCGASC